MGPDSCTNCVAGKYSETSGDAHCVDCDVGKYSASSSAVTCVSCNAGKFSAASSATSSAVCALCVAGKYGASSGVSVCSDCGLGKFTAAAGSDTCTACDISKYSSAVGATTCTDCPSDSDAPAGSSTCSPSIPSSSQQLDQVVVTMTVTMPYTKPDFNTARQDKYKDAVSIVADTTAADVGIASITEVRRRAGSVNVETKISASDSAGADKLALALGDGDALMRKINKELVAQGLLESTSVTIQYTAVTTSTPADSSGGGGGLPTAAVIGGVIGLVLLVAVATVTVWWRNRHSKTKSQPPANDVEVRTYENSSSSLNVLQLISQVVHSVADVWDICLCRQI